MASLGLSIRNQLLLVLVVIFVSLLSQSYVSTITQDNLAFIQDRRIEYTQRDRELLTSINELQSNSQELVQTRLEQLVNALLVNDINFPGVLISTFREDLNNLIIDFQSRAEIGYAVNESQLTEIPGIYSAESSIITNINNIIDPSELSIVDRLQGIQSDINAVITAVLTKADDLQGNYELLSQEYFDYSQNITSAVEQLFVYLDSLEVILEGDTNDAYVRLVQDQVKAFEDAMFEFVLDWNSIQTDWVSLLENDTVSLVDAVNNYANTNTSILNHITTTFTTLDNQEMNASENDIVNNINTTIVDTFIPSFTGMITSMKDLAAIRLDILRYTESNYVQEFQSTELLLDFVKTALNTETDEFVQLYDDLDTSFRAQSRDVLLGITSLLGVLTLLIVTPVILTLRGSLGRLQRNFKRVGQGDLTMSKRKNYSRNELGIVELEFDNLVENLRNIVSLVRQTAEHAYGISEELAAGTEEASASISEVSNTVSSMASGATQQNAMVNQMDSDLRALQQNIARVSSQINDASLLVMKMAQRTNILGLNASISAAKAGKYGEGFSVVANEIRDLSTSSKRSAVNISTLVEEVNFQLRETVQQMNSDFKRIRSLAEETASGSDLSTTSMRDQVYMIQEISESSNTLSDIAQRLNDQLKEFTIPE